MSANAFTGQFVADSHSTIRGWVKRNGAFMTQANFDAPGKIEWQAENPADDSVLVAWTTLTVADVIFDTPQTRADDPAWNRADSFNFRATVTPAAVPDGQANARIKIKFTASDGVISYGVVRGPISQLT